MFPASFACTLGFCAWLFRGNPARDARSLQTPAAVREPGADLTISQQETSRQQLLFPLTSCRGRPVLSHLEMPAARQKLLLPGELFPAWMRVTPGSLFLGPTVWPRGLPGTGAPRASPAPRDASRPACLPRVGTRKAITAENERKGRCEGKAGGCQTGSPCGVPLSNPAQGSGRSRRGFFIHFGARGGDFLPVSTWRAQLMSRALPAVQSSGGFFLSGAAPLTQTDSDAGC